MDPVEFSNIKQEMKIKNIQLAFLRKKLFKSLCIQSDTILEADSLIKIILTDAIYTEVPEEVLDSTRDFFGTFLSRQMRISRGCMEQYLRHGTGIETFNKKLDDINQKVGDHLTLSDIGDIFTLQDSLKEFVGMYITRLKYVMSERLKLLDMLGLLTETLDEY